LKGGADKERIMNDPNFQRTRENMSEFGTAVQKAKQIRLQLNNLIRTIADKSMRNRFSSLIHRIQKADNTAERGSRIFRDENSALLKGFEFNINSSLKALFTQDLIPSYDRIAGIVQLDVADFRPVSDVLLLEGATHMQFVLAGAMLGDEETLPKPKIDVSSYIPLVGSQQGLSLEVNLPPDTVEVVYLLVGISMFQETNDGYYPLNNRIYNAMTIVSVDIP